MRELILGLKETQTVSSSRSYHTTAVCICSFIHPVYIYLVPTICWALYKVRDSGSEKGLLMS